MTTTAPWMEWEETRKLIEIFRAAQIDMRFVGGCVRDGLLGRAVKDVDVATPAPPSTIAALLSEHGIKVVPTGIDHGTLTAVVKSRPFEITTLRRDVACDGRHAQVEFTADWKEDAARRDFTMNALYVSPEGVLTDFFGGKEDAEAGRIVFIGDPDQRIEEDALRILRFFRFYAHYGVGTVDAAGLAACARHHEAVAHLSGERIQHEMLTLLSAERVLPALAHMQEAKVLEAILGWKPSFKGLENLLEAEGQTQMAADNVRRLAALCLGKEAEACIAHLRAEWKLSNPTVKRLQEMVLGKPLPVEADEPMLKAYLRAVGKDIFLDKVLVGWEKEEYSKTAFRLAHTWKIPEFPVKGADLMAHGVLPGKTLGVLLRRLENQWEASGYKLTQEELLHSVTEGEGK